MTIQQLFIRRFRNYTESHFSFSQKMNVIVGPNALGKTSLLEAIHLLALGRSFRTTRTTDMIQREAESFFLDAQFESNGIEQRIAVAMSPREKRVIHNQTQYSSLSPLIGLLPVITMTPDDDLIKGGPDSRRKFLDLQIAQFDPLYLHYLTRYQRAMRHRNQLLRNHTLEAISPWEEEMARSATYVVKRRKSLTQSLQTLAQESHHYLSGDHGTLGLNYLSHFEGNFLDQYQKTRKKEVIMGHTMTGPHRDDLMIKIDDQEARHFASEGQKRTCVTALRLASWHLLKQQTGQNPLLLIDDFGVSLDELRRKQLLQCLPEFGQVFITCVDPLPLSDANVNIFEINKTG